MGCERAVFTEMGARRDEDLDALWWLRELWSDSYKVSHLVEMFLPP